MPGVWVSTRDAASSAARLQSASVTLAATRTQKRQLGSSNAGQPQLTRHSPMDHSVKGAASCCPGSSARRLREATRRARPSASTSASAAAAAASWARAVSPRRRRDSRVGSRGAGFCACVSVR